MTDTTGSTNGATPTLTTPSLVALTRRRAGRNRVSVAMPDKPVRLKDLTPVTAPWKSVNVEVTAAYAWTLLAGADPNRSIKEGKVNAFARSMLAGRWTLNATPVRLAPDGRLTDGEHRMWAVVRASDVNPHLTVPMTIATGVPREMRPTFDTGAARSFADVLKIEGRAPGNTRTYAGIVRYITLYTMGALTNGKTVQPSHEELEISLADPDVAKTVEAFCSVYARGLRQPSICGFVYWRAAQDDEPMADAWASGVMTGLEMGADDPRYLLRERYNEPRLKGSMAPEEAMALAIKSWNAFAAGDKLIDLRWRSRGKAAEGMPAFDSDVAPEVLSRAKRAKAKKRRQDAAALPKIQAKRAAAKAKAK